MKTYKETEKLIVRFVSDEIGTHQNAAGFTVHKYRGFDSTHGFPEIRHLIKNHGFESIPTGSNYCAECFSREMLSCVSSCEGDVYIIQYESIEELESEKKRAEEFYANN
jgi:hypothetical protein